MSSFTHGAGFRVVGVVVRKWLSPTGKFAALVLEVSEGPRPKKVDLRAFDAVVVGEIGELGNGMTVEVTGQIDMEKLTDKKREAVKVDGYEKWSPALTVKAIKIEGSSKAPVAKAPLPKLDESDVDF